MKQSQFNSFSHIVMFCYNIIGREWIYENKCGLAYSLHPQVKRDIMFEILQIIMNLQMKEPCIYGPK